jgi:hypothetical protein
VEKFKRTTARYFTARILLVVYLVIAMSPLAPIALRSPYLAHALTGECVGDCNICRCSPEQRANRTCCCQQKLKQQARLVSEIPDCCKNTKGSVTVFRCSCPCGSVKDLAQLNAPKSEVIPFVFDIGFRPPLADMAHREQPRLMPTRLGEPPDPPPRLSFSS